MSEETSKKLLITGASVIVGYTLKKLAEKSWQNVYGEDPPTSHPSEEINWKKVIIWMWSPARLSVLKNLLRNGI